LGSLTGAATSPASVSGRVTENEGAVIHIFNENWHSADEILLFAMHCKSK